jgi:DNA-binding PadR family transcriptional regulator
MQQLIRQWGKDQVVNVGQRASLYKMINRLVEAGLIRERATTRDTQYPERTTYELTDAGRAASRQWLDEILTTPRNEFPEFPAALSFLPMLTPEATRDLLRIRPDRLVERLAELDAALATELEGFALPRVTMLETEYLRAMTEAELRWVESILAGFADGSLDWNQEELAKLAEQLVT